MNNELDSPLVKSFLLNVTLKAEHARRAKLIAKLETIDVTKSPVALAIRDRLGELNIAVSTIQSVHCELGSYTKLLDVPIAGKLYLFQAEHPKKLIDAYEHGMRGEVLEFQLEFRCMRECTDPPQSQFSMYSLLNRIYDWMVGRVK